MINNRRCVVTTSISVLEGDRFEEVLCIKSTIMRRLHKLPILIVNGIFESSSKEREHGKEKDTNYYRLHKKEDVMMRSYIHTDLEDLLNTKSLQSLAQAISLTNHVSGIA